MTDTAIEDLPGLGLVDDIDTPINDASAAAPSTSSTSAIAADDDAQLERSQRKAMRRMKGEAKKADHRARLAANDARAAAGQTKSTKAARAALDPIAAMTVPTMASIGQHPSAAKKAKETKASDESGGVGECGHEQDDGGLMPVTSPHVGARPTCERCLKNLAAVALQETACKPCFLTMMRTKFRLQMRQSIDSRSTECIGVAYSGGPSSTSLLQLVSSCQLPDPESGRKMFFNFCAIHVDDTALLPLTQAERHAIVTEIAANAARSTAGAIRIVKLEDIWDFTGEHETIDAIGAGTIQLAKKRDDQAKAAAKALQKKAARQAANLAATGSTPLVSGVNEIKMPLASTPSTPSSTASTPSNRGGRDRTSSVASTASSTDGSSGRPVERKKLDVRTPTVRATPLTSAQIDDIIAVTPKTERLRALFAAIPDASDKTDLLAILTARAIANEAKQHCTMVLAGDNATRFAMRVIANTSKGRGASLPYELRDIDRRYNVHFVYPMREVLAKSAAFYNHWSSISVVAKPTFNTRKEIVKQPGINLLTESFVAELQSKYANTVSNIMRTTEKLHPSSTFDPSSVELPPDDDEPTPPPVKGGVVDLESSPSPSASSPSLPSPPPLVTTSPPVPQPPSICALCGRPVVAALDAAHGHGRTVIDQERAELSAAAAVARRPLCYGCSSLLLQPAIPPDADGRLLPYFLLVNPPSTATVTVASSAS